MSRKGNQTILLSAPVGVGIGHINRLIRIFETLSENQVIDVILYAHITEDLQKYIPSGWTIETPEKSIEETLETLSYAEYESANIQKLIQLIKQYDIDTILFDTYFFPKIFSYVSHITYYLILRNGSTAYWKEIREYFPYFRHIFLPHLRDEIAPEKQHLLSPHNNISYVGYVVEKHHHSPLPNTISISVGLGGDEENVASLLTYVISLIELYVLRGGSWKVLWFLGKHKDAMIQRFPLLKKFECYGFEVMQYGSVHIGRGGYNTVAEVQYNKIPSILFGAERIQESQDERIRFFEHSFDERIIHRGTHYRENDLLLLNQLIQKTPQKGTKNGEEIFSGAKNIATYIHNEWKKKSVLIFKHIFLPRSEYFIFREIIDFSHINPVILTLKREKNEFQKTSWNIYEYPYSEELLNQAYPYSRNTSVQYKDFFISLLGIIRKHNIQVIYCEFLFDAYFIEGIKKILPHLRIISACRGNDIYSFLPNVPNAHFLKHLDHFMVRDKTMQEFLMQYIDTKKISIARNALQIELYTQKKYIHKKKILFGGRFVPKKNLIALLHVLHRLIQLDPEYRFGLVGDGEEKENIFSKIREYNMETYITYYGFLDHKNLIEILDQYGVYIQYSKRTENGDDEGIPNLLIENILSGNLIFSTQAGGIGHIFTQKNQEFILSGNVETDTYSLHQSLQNESQYEDIRMFNREQVMRVLFGNENSKTEDKIRSIIEGEIQG